MTRLYGAPGNAGIAAVAQCVPIDGMNLDGLVRFAKEKRIDLAVIGPEGQSAPPAKLEKNDGGGKQPGFSLISLLIPDAYAQSAPDITLKTTAIQAIKTPMAQRFDSTLKASFDAGALGFTRDGMIDVRDASKIALKDRVAVNQAVADDNRDRKAVYREIAVANGHAEWETQIRETFAKQWVNSAHGGWWDQDAGGAGRQKWVP